MTANGDRPTSILCVLHDKLLRLGRDEDGAALVITLAIFFLMYLGCMGVYAISMAVKDRIHLQNACDAAAYSAAVVQADTLSRIATINRAMSWTYVQMTRRQMDYIVYRWLEETCKHHSEDMAMVQKYTVDHHDCGGCKYCPEKHCGECVQRKIGWDISDITLNDKGEEHSERDLRTEYSSGLPESMSKFSRSFYSQTPSLSGLEDQIRDDLREIRDMNDKSEELVEKLAGRIDAVVKDILDSNVPQAMRMAGCVYHVRRHQNPLEHDSEADMPRYLQSLDNSAEAEKRFIGFSNFRYLEHFRDGGDVRDSEVFDKGVDVWFVLGDERPECSSSEKGIHRSYDHSRGAAGCPLKASWEWFSTGWTCGEAYGIHWRFPNSFADETECKHSHELCQCGGAGVRGQEDTYLSSVTKHHHVHRHYSTGLVCKWVPSACYADNDACYDSSGGEVGYKGHLDGKAVYARPLVLNEDYFGGSGTITVGLACKNENAFARILGSIEGIFKAFDPDWNAGEDTGEVVDTHTYVFASAKAGYRYRDGLGGESDAELEYKVDWQTGVWHSKEQSWNLCQSDWDAVFVPVRKAACKAKDGRWDDGDDTILEKMVAVASNWKPLSPAATVPEWGQIKAPRGVLSGNGHDGEDLKWKELSHVMFH